uniref:Open rectifier potassium channel protein 1 n=1 Tax=Melanaphis sacchari TaxID=742174 RepID=A0A2H8TTQ8_9HEMI
MIGRWFVGFAVFVGYLCLGAFVFYRIERKEEEKRHYLEILERLELKELLAKHYAQVNAHVRKQFVQQLNAYCNKTVLDEGPDNEEVHQYQWTYYNAFFFALTTLSTIGYGNLHPTSCTGRILVLVYSLIGIPLNGIVLTQLGSFFESRILRAHYSYKTQRMMGPQLSLILDIVTYLIPGIIVFIFIPSGIISYFEDWTFDESVYFTFVTLTTIGYGDYVAGQTVNTNIWYDAYKVFLVFWIMFGLGYLFMILSFISRAMRSKTLEHLFLERLKQTHTKIWHQFTKDVVYIRRVLNESYLLKFKVRLVICIYYVR